MPKDNNILICPLDWGIGHATRCVPIIKILSDKGCNVVIAADNRPLAFLKQEFPGLTFIRFPGYRIRYQKKCSLFFTMLWQIPRIVIGIIREHQKLREIVRDYQVQAVISDNRFGLWHKNIFSIYLTHQIIIKSASGNYFLELILYRIHKYFIRHYDECWIPDAEGENNLSGDLSHRFKLSRNSYFIGPLSRFTLSDQDKEMEISTGQDLDIDIMVIISGPEPQRSFFEEMITEQIQKSNLKSVIVKGITEVNTNETHNERLEIYSHLPTDKMKTLIERSGMIICRPGYSSIMDLAALGKRAIFIPTPGQTEQIYLAKYHKSKNCFFYMNQKDFDLKYALQKSKSYQGILMDFQQETLLNRIKKLTENLYGFDYTESESNYEK